LPVAQAAVVEVFTNKDMNVHQTAHETSFDALTKILPAGFRTVIESTAPVNDNPASYTAIIHLECKTDDECDRCSIRFTKITCI